MAGSCFKTSISRKTFRSGILSNISHIMENNYQTDTADENSGECMRNGVYYKTQMCFKFMQGKCRYNSCKFAHGIHELRSPSNMAIPGDADHEFHGARNNNSNYGSIKDSSVHNNKREALNSDGFVVSQGFKRRRVCYQWEATGTCSFGDKCRYPHEALKIAEDGHEGFKNADSHVHPKPQSEWKLRTLNEYSVSCPIADNTAINAIHFTEKTANPVKNDHATSIHKTMENINNNLIQVSACQKRMPSWKGPQKISRIYGDWIDE